MSRMRGEYCIPQSLSATRTLAAPRSRGAENDAMDREQIQQCIPHRPPFLWLDEVVSMDGQRIHARKRLDPQLDVFRGHYPHFPVLPGVLQLEAAFQAGAVLISRLLSTGGDQVPVITR